MKMSLIVNAMDYLNWSMIHLTEFLSMDPYYRNKKKSSTYLKQVIINLNSCLELLFKKFISDKNELLIFNLVKNEQEIVDFYRSNNDRRKQGPLYDYFINCSEEVTTIPYNKCISLFCDLYNVGHPYRFSLEHLNSVRNTLMHLGINYKDEYYFLIGCISRILQYLEYEILPKLSK